MPKYAPRDDEMDSSYGNSPVEAPGAPGEKPGEPAPKSVDEENAGAYEVLIEKSKLPPGTKEGDTCTFKVSKDFGDEVSLKYVKSPQEGAADQTETPSAAESEIAALDKGE